MKRMIIASRLDSYGNKVPDEDQFAQDFVVTRTYTVYTEDDLDPDFLDYIGTSLSEFEEFGLYKPGRGIVLPVGTKLNYYRVTSSYAYYLLPDYGDIAIAISSDWWYDFKKHVKYV